MTSAFADRVAFITGGAGGIGRALADAFAREGATVVLADVNEQGAHRAAHDIVARGGRALGLRIDVTDIDSVKDGVDQACRAFGALHYAINNAGKLGPLVPLPAVPENDVDHLIAVNLTGTWHCLRHQIPVIQQSGDGAIVNIASVNGIRPVSNAALYSATKAGVIGLTRTAALELGASGVRINALCPGGTDTSMLDASVPNREQARSIIPMGRFARPDEIANLAVWLCSAAAGYLHGATIVADGGVHIQ